LANAGHRSGMSPAAPTVVLLSIAFPALCHDGIEEHGRRDRLPWFSVQTQQERIYGLGGEARRADERPLAAFSLLADQFTVIGIPDTQNYSSDFPQIFTAQTNWVVAQRNELDIRFVSHYGDIVNNADQVFQWENADTSMRILDDSGLPYGVCPGNHDITPSGGSGQPFIPQEYLARFGPSRFAGDSFYRGASPSGLSSYQYFTAGGVDFLALHLACDMPIAELAWAQGILDSNKRRCVMVTTHRYLQDAEDYTAGVPVVPSGRYPSIWYGVEGTYHPQGIQSDEAWAWFFRKNTNIFLINCGHFHEEYRQVSTNVAGKPVHEVLADYQDDPNGGDGWLRIMKFDTVSGTIDVDSYSPTLQAVRTADESDFNLSVDFPSYRLPPDRGFKAFQQGVGGYEGTQDTWVSQQNPNTSYGNNDTRVSDDDTANSIFTDYRGQALVRFDGVIGANQVPAGSTITNATLVIDVPDDIDTPFYNPSFFVHPVIRDWNESSTWNSLSGGLTVGADIAPAVGSFLGDSVPNGDSMRRINVTATVQAWANGAPNFGFAILPEIISGNDDGIEIRSSENGNMILRPRLEVTYVVVPTGGPDLDGNGVVDGSDLAILLGSWEGSGSADLDGNGVVDGGDLAQILGSWG
jgi:hypothetical protein